MSRSSEQIAPADIAVRLPNHLLNNPKLGAGQRGLLHHVLLYTIGKERGGECWVELTYGRAIFLGILQGLTEFLPVSSSGHLVLAQALLGLQLPGLTLEIMLHAGTALAIAVFFRADLARLLGGAMRREQASSRFLGLLVLASLPAAVIGVVAGEAVGAAMDSARLAAGMLLVTAGLLVLGPRMASGTPKAVSMRPSQALWIGLAQAFAILPGISRSGSTIVVGLLCGLERRQAARFSLLLALPVMLGGAAVDLFKLARQPVPELAAGALQVGPLLAGVLTAFALGLVAIRLLLLAVQRAKLAWFGLYCAVVAAVALALT